MEDPFKPFFALMPCTVHTHLVVAVVERGRVGSLETRAQALADELGLRKTVCVCVRGKRKGGGGH